MAARLGELLAATVVPPTAVVLDIDGVIGPIGGPTAWGDDVTVGDPDDGLVLSSAMCAALDKLDRYAQTAC